MSFSRVIEGGGRAMTPALSKKWPRAAAVWLNSLGGLAPFGALQAFAFWLPLLLFVSFAFAGGTPWADLWVSSAKIASIRRTLWIAAQVTVISGMLAYVYVGALLAAPPRRRTVLLLCMVVPFLTSIVVRTYAWIVVLGPSGPVNAALRALFGSNATIEFIYNRSGVLIGMVHVLLPIFVMPLYAVSLQIPQNLNRAARAMGANCAAAWFAVDVRLGLPGAAAGAALVFIQALGFFVTPSMLGGLGDTMVAQFIDHDMHTSADLGAAASLSLVLVAAVALCVLVFRLFYPLETLFTRAAPAEAVCDHSTRDAGPHLLPAGITEAVDRAWLVVTELLAKLPWAWLARAGGIAIAFYFLLPLVVVLPVSLTADEFLQFPPHSYDGRWYPRVLLDPDWRLAIRNSLLVGIMAVTATVGVALPLAFVVVRSALRQSLRGVLIGVLLVPAIVPTIILSVGVYVWFLNIKLIANLPALALAHAVLGLPFAVLILVSTLRDFDSRLEHAARSLGAGPVRTLALVTLPLLFAALVTGALLAFLTSFDELLIARAVTNFNTVTLPVKLWNGANEEISPALAVISVISMAVTLIGAAFLALLSRQIGRRKGEGG
jgi:putative spermidine/putrescine transport system permease protein